MLRRGHKRCDYSFRAVLRSLRRFGRVALGAMDRDLDAVVLAGQQATSHDKKTAPIIPTSVVCTSPRHDKLVLCRPLALHMPERYSTLALLTKLDVAPGLALILHPPSSTMSRHLCLKPFPHSPGTTPYLRPAWATNPCAFAVRLSERFAMLLSLQQCYCYRAIMLL